MLHFPRWRVVLVIIASLWSIIYTLPNLLTGEIRDRLPGWVPKQTVNLGLDLRGGSYLLLEVDTRALLKERLEAEADNMAKALQDAKPRIAYTGRGVAGDAARLRLVDPADTQRALGVLRKLYAPSAAAALTGGSSEPDFALAQSEEGYLEARMTKAGLEKQARDAVTRSIEVIRRRIDAMGTSEVSIVRQGADRINVQAPGVSDPEALKRSIGTTAKMTFHLVDESVTPSDIMAGRAPPGSEILPADKPNEAPTAIRTRMLLSGDDLSDAQPAFDQQTQTPIVTFHFTQRGARVFCQITSQNVGKRFATVLDGKVITAPVIRSSICGGTGQIEGGFTVESANELAVLLRAGALPAPLAVVEQRTVGAELGQDAIVSGAMAGIVASGAVVVFMVLAYGLFGVLACLALVINIAMIIAAMSIGGATLSLPGIAGLILTIGMAVDANVLVYERMREEQAAGRGPAMAINAGFSRALVTIIDSHVTQIGAALILFQFGHGPVRGFAWTLSIGVLTSVFTATMVTQLFIAMWFRAAQPKKLPI
ncbi:MAG: protein translocase subunit SecD [Hyphomonadaceae bacterium]